MSTERHLTMLVPGLMLFEHAQLQGLWKDQPRLRALELLLSRAEKSTLPARSYNHILFDLFNVPFVKDKELPIAALQYFLHRGQANVDEHFICADPVYLVPQRGQLLNYGNALLDITVDEAQQLVNDINQQYKDQAWQLIMLTPLNWVMKLPGSINIATHALDQVVGMPVDNCLPTGNDAPQWCTLLNELQMFLHSHPVNQQRMTKGKPAINSVWFWGSGNLPKVDSGNQRDSQERWVQCWSHDTLALSLAKLANVPRVDASENAQAWLAQAITPGAHILVDVRFKTSLSLLDAGAWWQALFEFNNAWIQPLYDALQGGAIKSLTLLTDTGEQYCGTRRRLKRWWKPVKHIH